MNRSLQIKALSSEVRIKILKLLGDPKTNFSEQWSADPEAVGVCMTLIARAIEVAQPTASRHLDILKQAGFITVTRVENWSHCKRDDDAIKEYFGWMKTELQLR